MIKRGVFTIPGCVNLRLLAIASVLPLAFMSSVARGQCCLVDTAADAPPANSRGQKAPLHSAPSRLGAPATFRTDTGPELDLYQPCSGGDNLIDFNINVHDIDVAAITSVTLTLAVWDVDFDCGGACGGSCERDTVYINGHRLLTPVSYLTGANQQWSTVSFDVDPSWLVDGDNQIQVFIDTLGHGCWCVTCDWGELALELGTTPAIDEIIITPDYHTDGAPCLAGDPVTFEARIDTGTGYTVTSVDWLVVDTTSSKKVFAKKNRNPYTYTPSVKSRGAKTAICTVFYENDTTGDTGVDLDSREFVIYFKKEEDSSFWNNKPNWFRFWRADGAVPGFDPDIKFSPGTSSYGQWHLGSITLYPAAAGMHYGWPVDVTTDRGVEHFGGPHVEGIDSVSEVIAHEKKHKYVDQELSGDDTDTWQDARTTMPLPLDLPSWLEALRQFLGWPLIYDTGDRCPDGLPDSYETTTSGTDPDDPDTFDVCGARRKPLTHGYSTYGDQELEAMRAANLAERGDPDKDWAYPGSQFPPAGSSPRMTRIVGTSTPDAASALPAEYSDSVQDSDGDGYWDVLIVTMPVDIPADGTYSVAGVLRASSGERIDSVHTSSEFLAGVQGIRLEFSGLLINHYGFDGPYTVGVSVADGLGDLIVHEDDAYVTGFYNHAMFEGQEASYAGSCSHYGVDSDSNGVYESLVVDTGLVVDRADVYTLEAYLLDATGGVVSFASSTDGVSPGSQAISLVFDGNDIALSRADGPYVLGDISLMDSAGKLVDFRESGCVVEPYGWIDFGDAPVFGVGLTDYGVDSNGNGLYESLNVEIPVNMPFPGNYIVTGTLVDIGNDPIDVAIVNRAFSAGMQNITLEFSGVAIWLNQVDGPYTLRYALVYDNEGDLLDLLSSEHVTAGYLYAEFERPAVALAGGYSDYVRDPDNDGVNEYLAVEVEVIVANAGNYALNARLMDGAGQEIVWAATTAWLPADLVEAMRLDFDGPSIFAHGVDGPYHVRDVHLYNVANPALSANVYDAHTTEDYSYWVFGEEVPPVAEAGGPYYGTVGEPVTLDASGSYDPNGTIVLYEWDWDSDGVWDDDTPAPVITHIWADVFDGTVRLRVTDNAGLTGVDTARVVVCNPASCDDGNLCTTEECVNGECVNTSNSLPCDDSDACTTNDRCIAGWCIGDRMDADNDCHCDLYDICPGRPDCRFEPEGSCPEVAFHVAILQDRSDLDCDGRADCTTNDPPASCEEVVACADFVVEVWGTKFSQASGDPGISCAYVDLMSHVPVFHKPSAGADCTIEYGAAFNAGPDLESGMCMPDGSVADLGSCALSPGGVGVWPEWVLLARVQLEQVHGEGVHYDLADSAIGTSVSGQGFANTIDYGEACFSTIDCQGHIYDRDSDCYIGPGDLGLFAGCWLLCPDDPGYDTGLLGESCDGANFAKCSADDCVGPEDFSFFMSGWQKYCDDASISVPDCGRSSAAQTNLPTLPSAEVLRSLGLEPPAVDWKGNERGMLRELRRLEAKRRLIKDRSSIRGSAGERIER